MLPPHIAASMLDGSSSDPNTWLRKQARDALVTLHLRTVDALKGYVKMVEKAEPEFRPVAQLFHDLHSRATLPRIAGTACRHGCRPSIPTAP